MCALIRLFDSHKDVILHLIERELFQTEYKFDKYNGYNSKRKNMRFWEKTASVYTTVLEKGIMVSQFFVFQSLYNVIIL